MSNSISIGVDVHAGKNCVFALDRDTGEALEATLSGDPAELVRWIGENGLSGGTCCYEAGPTGFGLARALAAAGIRCVVAATSKLPRRSDRRKNDRVDAEWLARMHAAGSVRAVRVPTEREESLRHLSRLRGEVARDLRAARQRVASFLLLTGTRYALTKRRWTKTFRRWAAALEFAQPADTFVFRQKLAAVYRLEERLAEVEAEIARAVASSPGLAERMARLECIRGIGRVTAFSLVCEVCDFRRFRNGSALASYIGLVPSESSTGSRTRRGGISKTGSSHLRRALVEAASAYSRPCRGASAPEDPSVPALVRARAAECSRRLRRRREHLVGRGLAANKVKVAVARELCEWIWWIAVMPA
ncbi:MAG TPA: IS110 family transposase [Collinsella ihuae]|uniref:IS110 family transposase n=1 Tax=Collinsella ihumii TaxID=1720204 RepID=A0A921IQ57_9ACTN|nr:IS110 family transposase [Collinsella ihumii]